MKSALLTSVMLSTLILVGCSPHRPMPVQKYFPLHKGDTWRYVFNVRSRPLEVTRTIIGTVERGGLDFVAIGENISLRPKPQRQVFYYRVDDAGRVQDYVIDDRQHVWRREAGSYCTINTIYNFDANPGDTWIAYGYSLLSEPISGQLRVSFVSRTDSVKVGSQWIRDCIKFHIEPVGVFDADWWEWYAKDIGLVKWMSIWGYGCTLTEFTPGKPS